MSGRLPDDPRALREIVGREDPSWSAEREARLVDRVLAATTRGVEPGWRGDLRLVGAFVVERFRSSRALRVAAAASLVVHLAAVPVLAWWLLDEEPRSARLRFEPPATDPFEEALPEPARELDVPADWTAGSDAGGVPEAAADARRLARFLLHRHGAPRAPESAGAPRGAELLEPLAARSALASETASGLADVGRAAWESAGPLARCLWAEAALDAYVLRKELPVWWAEIDPALRSLEREAGPVAALASSTRSRGAVYAAWPDADLEEPPPADPLAGDPFRGAWNAALRAALEREGALTPSLARWLEGAGARTR